MNKIIITSALVGLMLFSGVVLAQTADLPAPGIMPGNPFFFLSQIFEGIGDAFTFGESAKAERALKIAEKRLSAAQVLALKGDENAQKAIALYEQKLAQAAERAQTAQNADLLVLVTEATSKHFGVLEGIIEQVPEQAKAAVQRALDSSKQGQISALAALEREDSSLAVHAGLSAVQAHAERAKTNAQRNRLENAQEAAKDLQRVLALVSDAPRGSAALETKFSEKLTETVENLDEAKNAAIDIPAEIKEKINEVKGLVIDAQLTSLSELVREDPARAVEIFAKAAESRLNAAKRNAEEEKNEDATKESLEDYNKYAEFGQQISSMAEGIQTGETTVEELVKKATSHHLQVLEDVRQKLPSQAQQEFQRALDNSQRVQEQRPVIPAPTQPTAPQPGQPPTQPEVEIDPGTPQQETPGGRP